MTKVLILTSKKRVKKYSKPEDIPENWQIVFLDKAYTEDEALRTGADADFILVDVIYPVSANLIAKMPNLKLIHTEGVGYDRINTNAAAQRGIYVCNNAGVNAASVAEQTILLMLALLRRLLEGDKEVRLGRLSESKSRFILDGITELGSCHVGLIGLGAIGLETAKRLNAFGCKISYYDIKRAPAETEAEHGLTFLPLKDLLSVAEIISLHLPVLPDTVNLIDAEMLKIMKPNTLLINTARGKIIDQKALADALVNGNIKGAGLDTLYPEPTGKNHPLLNLPESVQYKLVFSPHIGGTTNQDFERAHHNAWLNMQKVANGERPNNIVNGL